MKKFNSLLLTAVLLISAFAPVVSASDSYAEWKYKSLYNITSFALSGGTSLYSRKDNVYGMRAVPGSKDTIFVDVADSFIYDNIYTPVDISVTYWDAADGGFYLTYDAFDTSKLKAEPKKTETVNYTGTESWITKTFKLRDAAFYNRCSNVDFTISASGNDALIVSSVRVSEHYGEALIPMYMYVESDLPGNNFTLTDQAFDITLLSCDKESDFKLVYSVLDREGNVIKSNISRMSMAANERKNLKYYPNIDKYGLYTFRLEVVYKDGDFVKEVPFAVINDGTGHQNPHFGAATHMEQYQDPESVMELMRKAGLSGSRGGLTTSWHNVEKGAKGNYIFPDESDKIINMLLEKDLEPCFSCLGYNNKLYNGKEYLTCVTDDETLEGAKNYTAYIAEKFGNKITYYEDWNEFNSHTSAQYSSKAEMAAEYTKLLKAKSEGIKSKNPNAKIVSMVTSMNDAEFIREALKAGAYQYSDVISVHPYIWGPYNREVHLEDIRELYDIIAEYTPEGEQPLPLWFTEIGWATNTSGVYGVTEDKQAEYAVKMFIDTIGNGLAEKIFWYDFINDGTDKTDKEKCFGFVNEEDAEFPMTAKKSYVAVAGMNSLLYDAEIIDTMKYGDDIIIYRFGKSDGSQILALWCDDGTETVNIKLGASNVTCYDMFSNIIKTASDSSGCYSFEVGNDPCYVAGDFTAFERFFDSESVTIEMTGASTCTDYDETPFEVLIKNTGERLDGKLTMTISDDRGELVSENVTVPAGGNFKKAIKLPRLAAGQYSVKAAYSVDNAIAETETYLNVTSDKMSAPVISHNNSGILNIKGTSDAYKDIGVVIKSDAKIAYVGQTKSDGDGNYEVNAKVPSDDIYYVFINDGAINIREFSDAIRIDFEVKRGDTVIKNLSEICDGDTVTLHILVKDNGKIGEDNARLYCVINGESHMIDVKSLDISSNEEREISFTVGKADEINSFDILLWDKSMTPLKNKQQFK